MKKFFTKKGGFTLVESLVAIMIVLTAITGAFSVAQGGLGASNLAKERVTAYFLAQETIESVKNARDHNNLERYKANGGSSPKWLENIFSEDPDLCTTSNPCDWSMDFNDPTNPSHAFYLGDFISCNSINGCLLYTDSNGIYSHVSSGGTASGFTRKLSIVESTTDVEAKITVTVTWRGGTQSVKIEENIYNWSVPATL